MIPVCKYQGCSKPAFVEPRTKTLHSYCGRTHASLGERRKIDPPHGDCMTCNLNGCARQVFFEEATGRVHDFCCGKHAEKAIARGQWPIPKRDQQNGKIPTHLQCKLAGCKLPRFKEYDYCGRTHAIEAVASNESTDVASTASFSSRSQSLSSSNHIPGQSGSICGSGEIFFDLEKAIALSMEEQRKRKGTKEEEEEEDKFANSPKKASKRQRAVFQPSDEERRADQYWETISLTAASWPCKTCSKLNIKESTVCNQCKEPKFVELDWACSNCTFDNVESDSLCFMCGAARAQPKSAGGGGGGGGVKSAKQMSQCGIPGCPLPSIHFGFCSKSHSDRAEAKRIVAPGEEGVEVVLVGEEGDYTAHLLRVSHPRFLSVKKQFLAGWKHPGPPPRVERIYWIHVKPHILEAFKIKGQSIGNVQRRFHGTGQNAVCEFGVSSSCAPCSGNDCPVCSICKLGFDLRFVREGGGRAWNGMLRFGPGIYFSQTSSKSNDYSSKSERRRNAERGLARGWRSMFLCNVAIGKSFNTQLGELPANQCPPPGFDSVVGEVGAVLNYDEVVVYDESQAVPSYLIVYSLD